MLHLKNSVTNKKPKKMMGFSLIELLVVVGIIGILAAVAIPAYNQYRESAAQGAFDATGTNVVRAFQSCVAINPFASCDTLAELGIDVSAYTGMAGNKAPNFCVELETEIGGEIFMGCYSVNASTSLVNSTFNENVCFNDGPTTAMHDGMACGTGVQSSTLNTWDPCDTQALPTTRCTVDGDCTGAGVGVVCNTKGTKGICDVTDGTCS